MTSEGSAVRPRTSLSIGGTEAKTPVGNTRNACADTGEGEHFG